MKKLYLAPFLCLFMSFFAFGEDLPTYDLRAPDFQASDFLTYIKEYSRPGKNKAARNPRVSEQIPLKSIAVFTGLGQQSTGQQSNGLPGKANISIINDWAFAYTDLTTVNIPEGVTAIGKGAFANNALSSVMLPLSLQTIDEWAFAHNNISSLVFPENLTSIGEYAFWGNRITDVTLGSFVQLSREAIDSEFYEAYNQEQKAAGHYIRKDGIWLREPGESR
jgi:hypothetical protein